MFIIWGKKVVYRRVGHVADFCPVCREARCFELKRVGMAGHIYYITAGEGELVGFERSCASCGTAVEAKPERYVAIAKKPAPLEQLKRETFPTLDQDCAAQLQLAEQIRDDPASLSGADRHVLIRHPFLLLSPRVEQRFASTHMDKEVGLALVGALLLMGMGPGATAVLLPDAEPEAVMLSLIVAAVLLVLWQVGMARMRFIRRQVFPVLTTALLPLRPAQNEIERAMAELAQLGHKIGSKFKAGELLAHMQARKA